MENRIAKTSINHYPIGDSVIIRRTTEHSGVAILGSRNEDALFGKDPILKRLEIVAYGDQTHTIEIGDEVHIDFSTLLQEVKVNDNSKSFTDIKQELMKSESTLKNTDNFDIIKYYRISFYNIYSIVNSNRFNKD